MKSLGFAMLCPAGLENVVSAAAQAEYSALMVESVSSGFLSGTVEAALSDLRRFPCATNVFNVIGRCPRSSIDAELANLATILAAASNVRLAASPSRSTFRLRIHDDGRFSPLRQLNTRRLTGELARRSGFDFCPASGRTEFWLIRRREQADVVLATKLSAKKPMPERGVLRPEICAAMAALSRVRDMQLVLDPFAGSGALGVACARAGARQVWINDSDPDCVAIDNVPKSLRDRVRATHFDFRQLDVDPHSICAVVTDPPWGRINDPSEGLEVLYDDFGRMARTWLAGAGTLTVLSGAPATAIDAMLNAGAFSEAERISILVNGAKASIISASAS